MKLVKMKTQPLRKDFLEFAEKYLPFSIKIHEEYCGYGGSEYSIKSNGAVIGKPDLSYGFFNWREFSSKGPLVEIKLYDPKFLSDMEDLARKWESSGGSEVTIKYCDEAQ